MSRLAGHEAGDDGGTIHAWDELARLAAVRARKREDLLQATEAILRRIADIVRRKGSKLRGLEKINRRVGREAYRRKVEKHFDIAVKDDELMFKRNAEKIAAEARLDGIYIVRTSLDAHWCVF